MNNIIIWISIIIASLFAVFNWAIIKYMSKKISMINILSVQAILLFFVYIVIFIISKNDKNILSEYKTLNIKEIILFLVITIIFAISTYWFSTSLKRSNISFILPTRAIIYIICAVIVSILVFKDTFNNFEIASFCMFFIGLVLMFLGTYSKKNKLIN